MSLVYFALGLVGFLLVYSLGFKDGYKFRSNEILEKQQKMQREYGKEVNDA